ncbi:hypothetical protein JDS73_25635 [Bacillus cereus]|nr:hypothetical protein [Bacillus cereus]
MRIFTVYKNITLKILSRKQVDKILLQSFLIAAYFLINKKAMAFENDKRRFTTPFADRNQIRAKRNYFN